MEKAEFEKYWNAVTEAYKELSLRQRLDQGREIQKLAAEYIAAYRKTTTYEMFCQMWSGTYPHLAAPPAEMYILMVGAIFSVFATGLTMEVTAFEHEAKKQECVVEELKEKDEKDKVPSKPPVIYL